jgi:2-amino-4-hydroxy-6-hydroxymethyldihydropteridine diphosphokinase
MEPDPTRTAIAALAFGSNIGDKAGNIRAAAARLDARPDITLVALSPLYRTEPWGLTDQDWFVNACALVTTTLDPHGLLAACKAVEAELGRRQAVRWGPRLIDIDVLAFDGIRLDTPALTIPHPRMRERAFVLVPLAEIAPEMDVGGVTAKEALEAVGRKGVEILRDSG